MTSDWVIGSRYLSEYYDTMAAWLDRRVTGKRWPETKSLATAILDYACRCSCSSIHEVPNLSLSMANREAKKVDSIFMKISPPSASGGGRTHARP